MSGPPPLTVARRPGRGARALRAALVAALALVLAATALTAYARWEMRDSGEFAARVGSSLESPEVRDVLAQRAVDAITASAAPNALTLRPLLVRGFAALADTPQFRALLEEAIRRRHAQLGHGDAAYAVRLPLDRGPVRRAIRRVSPRLADALPSAISVEVAALRPHGIELMMARIIRLLAGLFWPLVAASVALVGLRTVLVTGSGRVRGVLADASLAVAGGGALVLLVLASLERIVVAHASHAADLSGDVERTAVQAVWGALFDDLRSSTLIAALAGAALATLLSGRRPATLLKGVAARIRATPRPRRWSRVAQALVMVGLGVALVMTPTGTVRALATVAGVALLLVGAAELAGRLAPTAPTPGGPALRAGAPPALAAAVALIVVATAAAVVFVVPAPSPAPVPMAAPDACNGSRALCAKRLDEVVFPATHNSYAAADEPGWLFANQRFGIARQLRDGIRGLLIDLHYGVRDPRRKIVRTDLRYEGSSRNKVAQQLSPEAVGLADRLAGRPVGGDLKGRREVFLCHTLCELGSEPVGQELGVIRRFLDTHRRDVLIVFVEPYVANEDVARAFDAARLTDDTIVLRPGAVLPTLGELVSSGRRLLVLSEEDGGTPPWYLSGFTFAQETPYKAKRPGQLSCRRLRGEADSPLFLLNHWIATFPPSRKANRAIGGTFLSQRIATCERRRDRRVNLPAVDFYEDSGVVDIARALNERRGP